MSRLIPIILLASALVPSFGQGINLSGIVTDSAGAPVAAATVKLEAGGQTTTSGPDGKFVLTGGTGVMDPHRQAPMAAIREGSLFLSIPEKSNLIITAYGPEGRALSSLQRRMEAGSHRLDLPRSGSGVRFFKVTAGGHETVVKALSIDGAVRGAALGPQESFPQPGLAKTAPGAAPLYDVISATKTGFLKSYVSISNSDSSNIKIKLLGPNTAKFSFFLTSLKAMVELSGSAKGFGGDLRFGETGPGAGLRGADKICNATAEKSMPNSSFKGWRAFLSVAADASGKPANAIDRVGEGPWYDRLGRTLALKKADLLAVRPANADPAIQNDLPNEFGVPNRRPDPSKPEEDNHHVLTGSDAMGKLYGPTATCLSWTSTASTSGRPRVGFSFPAGNRLNWISGQDEGGCGAGVNLVETGGSDPSNPIVGSGGGYGAIFCLALNP